MGDATLGPRQTSHHRWRRTIVGLLFIIGVWAVVAYLVMPAWWKDYTRRHPEFADLANITQTGTGIPGDPVNVALVGTKEELVKRMLAAGWSPADPLSLKSSLEIAVDAVFKRPDPDAPVSNLYLFGRKEDIAFEQEVNDNPRHRHHVRFWQTDWSAADGRPVWLGSAVYDKRVGLSHTTGQVTHVTAANIDAERDFMFACLEKSHGLSKQFAIDDFHTVRVGKNGGGDEWRTDGRLFVGLLAPIAK